MSSFGTGGNWWQGLQGLFGGQQGVGARSNDPFDQQRNRYDPYDPFSGFRFPQVSGGIFGTGLQGRPLAGQPSQSQMPTYGQALAGAAAADYQRAEQARQQELAQYQGLLANVLGGMQGAGQMVGGAQQMGQQNMDLLQQQAGRMREATGQGQQYFDLARRQMESSLGEARQRMDQGLGTLREARAGFDAGRRDDTAAQVMGIQQQYQNQLEAITRRDDLTEEQKSLMRSELQQGMRQQSAGLAAQADARARDTMLALDQNIAQMEGMAGTQLGQFGIGVGQTIGQLGAQQAALASQTEQQVGSFFTNMAQFNSSLIQSAQANALQYVLNGNQLAANIIQAQPLGPLSIFDTLLRMVGAADERRAGRVSPEMGGLFGRIA